jgi:hypothetical protein
LENFLMMGHRRHAPVGSAHFGGFPISQGGEREKYARRPCFTAILVQPRSMSAFSTPHGSQQPLQQRYRRLPLGLLARLRDIFARSPDRSIASSAPVTRAAGSRSGQVFFRPRC